MGRFFGKRPDPTATVTRAARGFLEPGERVLAGLLVQSPGTSSAEWSGAVLGAAAGAADVVPTVFNSAKADRHTVQWLEETAPLGVDPDVARRTILMLFVLTNTRMLLIRRSRLTLRPRELVGAWPLNEVERIRAHRSSGYLLLTLAGGELRLELPLAHKFLPDVYRDVPNVLAAAKDAQSQG